jgi:nucleotide-binding universal stress UspA family protein
MTALERVLVPTDFSPGAARALERVALLPLASRATVTLLHVIPDAVSPALLARERSEAEYRLKQAGRALAERLRTRTLTEVAVRRAVRTGEPSSKISREADRLGADLIVVGRHGKRRFRDLLLGSTVERIVRKGAAPVLVVAGERPRPYRSPWVAVDLSDPSRRALALAVRLAAPTAGKVRIVHAYATPFEGPLGRGASPRHVSRYRRECRLNAQVEVAAFLAASRGRSRVGDVALRRGDPRRAILSIGRREGADLLAVGSHGRTGLPRFLLGSVSEAVIHHATCDVLIAPGKVPRSARD